MVPRTATKVVLCWLSVVCVCLSVPLFGQLVDKNKAPNVANEGITRPLIGGPYPSQIGEGRTGCT